MPRVSLRSLLLRPLLEHSRPFERIAGRITERDPWICLQNLQGASFAYFLAGLRARFPGRPILAVAPALERAEEIFDDLLFFQSSPAFHYPRWETLPYDEEEPHLEILAKQLDVFSALLRFRENPAPDSAPLIVTSIDALMQKILPLEEFRRLSLALEWGGKVPLETLAGRLAEAGYERQPAVESRGEFSVRGGIVDVYPPNADAPYRLDFFGDEIESIRLFDASTQRSTSDLGADARIEIPPARLREPMFERLRDPDALLSTLLESLPRQTLIVLDERLKFLARADFFEQAASRQFNEILNAREGVPHPDRILVSLEDIEDAFAEFQVLSHSLLPPDPDRPKAVRVSFATSGFSHMPSDLDAWITLARHRQAEDHQVVILCDNEGQAQRFDEVLREREMAVRILLPAEQDSIEYRPRDATEGYPDILLTLGSLHSGFSSEDLRLTLFTDREVFGRYKRRHSYRRLYKGTPVAGASDIQRGDYVVHVENGVGRFLGLRRQMIDGRAVDLLEIEYAEGNKLLVPVENIRLVQKFSGVDDAPPALDRLGSGRWKRRREKAGEDIERMARELLDLYARREIAQRDPFSPDKAAQAEFEASFLYTETPDQIAAIEAVKGDMTRERPMDRLVCGDVGYGKTEVAIRAIFKCVMEGRQAAVLTPTTILALQHFNTFRERFAGYPIRVEMLSRFRGPREHRETIQRLRTGEVQVVVGTHRLLSKDVVFADLGLVVVDEEQRFGVRHKERLKQMRESVDFLTLTATPIPRTLYMALSGLRDLSVINTPPPDRYPIKTRIIHFEEEQVAEALLRELNRGGQVFFVHNRIHNIQEIADRIRKIVPSARIATAHGQLSDDDLEQIMLDFYERKYDILVSTTIIENGLDIPNCNTIIINRADAFGLAQLYQLRGRVGRAKRRAYAYLIVPKGQRITETAVKRLQAIEEFTELGSGFNIAMRDMEIRGAGNLLGEKQHGLINQIGFELYCELLQEAVERLKGQEPVALAEVEIRWKTEATLPPEYIPVETQRLAFYKRIATARDLPALEEIADELRDRYGERPLAVENLLIAARLRATAARAGVKTIAVQSDGAARLTPAAIPAAEFTALLREAAESAGLEARLRLRTLGAESEARFDAPTCPARIELLTRLLAALG